tara:strand:- start:1929 stop:2162 length:234 start_codon:yes stop_codon:yes gene_type:complete
MPDMALQFEGPNSGWELSCDGCWDLMFMHRWDDASSLVLEAEQQGWKLDEYPDWDGVTYADAQCHECVQLQQEDEDE